MSTITATPAVESSVLQKYAPALGTFLVLILGAVQQIVGHPFTLVVGLQFASLALGSALAILVPLVKGPWAGAAKTGVEVILTGIALVLPYAITGNITSPEVILVVIGLVKAFATQIGVVIRADDAVASAPTPVVVTAGTPSAIETVPVASGD